MDIEAVRKKFGSWANPFQSFIESKEFDGIFKHLIAAKGRGKKILPDSQVTFDAFKKTPFSRLRAVMLFSGPYEKVVRDKPMADGLGLSCSVTKKPTTGLDRFYRAMERDLAGGLNLDMIDEPDLSYLSAQGILLLNAALTVEQDKPGCHQQLWRPFMEYFFNQVLNADFNVPVVFWGRQPAGYAKLVYPFNNWIFEGPGLMAIDQEDPWDGGNIFKNLDRIIREQHPDDPPLTWYKTAASNA